MNTIPVFKITENASRDSMSDSDYLGIIESLRGPLFGYSWQRIADVTGYNSKAWWALVAKGERSLDDEARNALRRVTDGELPEQPPSVMAVTEQMVDVDAEMLLVGTLEPGERVRRVLLMAANDVTLHVNGAVTAEPLQGDLRRFDDEHNETHTHENVTPVTHATSSHKANRAPVYRPVFSTDEKERFESFGGLRRIIDAGVKALREDGR